MDTSDFTRNTHTAALCSHQEFFAKLAIGCQPAFVCIQNSGFSDCAQQ